MLSFKFDWLDLVKVDWLDGRVNNSIALTAYAKLSWEKFVPLYQLSWRAVIFWQQDREGGEMDSGLIQE